MINELHIEGDLGYYTLTEVAQIRASLGNITGGKWLDPLDNKKMIMTGGAPATGKSRFAHHFAESHSNYVLIDTNDVCLRTLSGFHKDYKQSTPVNAYSKWRAASIWLRDEAIRETINSGKNLIMAGTATSPETFDLIETATTKGYKIEFFSFAAPLRICEERNKAANRLSYLHPEKRNGAFELPPSHMTGKRDIYLEQLPSLTRTANIAFTQLWNPSNAQEPIVAFTVRNGELSVKDEEATAAFITDSSWKIEGGNIAASLHKILHLG